MTIEPDGKPRVKEFGNLRKMSNVNQSGHNNFCLGSKIMKERAPLGDVHSTNRKVKVIFEIPGVRKEDIKINANYTMVDIDANDSQRKYHKIIELPYDADIHTARSTYNNGILEIPLAKRSRLTNQSRYLKFLPYSQIFVNSFLLNACDYYKSYLWTKIDTFPVIIYVQRYTCPALVS